MWKATLKGLLAHKLRLGLTALAVVLGISFVSGTYVLTDTISVGFDRLFADATAGIDVYVRSANAFASRLGDDRKPFSEAVLERVEDVDGVAAAYPSVAGYAQLVDPGGDAIAPLGPPTIGASWSGNPDGAVTIRSGRPPRRDREVAIDAATARRHGFAPGDRVRILFVGSAERFTITGIAGFGLADNLGGATLALFEFETSQRVLDRRGRLDAIEVVADPGVAAAVLRARIAAVLPKGVEAATGTTVAADQAGAIKQNLGFLNTGLLVFAGVALFVAAFLIFNTFSIVIAHRAREFALLRALGASRAQVAASVAAEAVIVGALASAAGLFLGLGLAVVLEKLLGMIGGDVPAAPLEMRPRTVAVSLMLGTAVTLAASLVPARRAARAAPVEAMRGPDVVPSGWSSRRIGAGGIALVAGTGAGAAGLFGSAAPPVAYVGAGALTILVGVAIVSPVAARPLVHVLAAPAARARGLPARLAGLNAARNPKRTAATAGALMVGLALVSFAAIFAASLKQSAAELISDSLRADFMITTESFGPATGFSPEIADSLARRPEIGAVGRMRFGLWRYDATTKDLNAVDPGTFADTVDIGSGHERVGRLAGGGVLIQRDTAADLGIEPGDVLDMEFAATGRRRVEVVGTYEKSGIVGDFLVSTDFYDDNFDRRLDDFVAVKAAPGVPPARARAAVEDVVERWPGVTVQDQAELRERSSEQLDQVLGLVNALLGLALVIALLGVTNTLVLSVFERTREIGLLRAVGMARSQTRAMIRWEGAMIAVLGAVLGVAVGVCFGWAVVRALHDEGITVLAVPPVQLALYVAGAALAGVAAALPPARRAARLDVLRAIAYE